MFNAILIERDPYRASLASLDEAQLPAGEVTVRVAYSTLNYKDALAITGKGPVVRQFPMVPESISPASSRLPAMPLTSKVTRLS